MSARPSLTRARAFATRARPSAARSERGPRTHGGQDQEPSEASPSPARAREGARHRRAPAHLVFRSNRGVTAQLIDDDAGKTLAAVSWTEDDIRKLDRAEQAKKVGETLAKRAGDAGIKSCVFDRGGYRYHGRVAALAEGAREGGLEF